MTQRQIHNLELGEVWSLLRSRSEGLRPDEVAQRLAEIGPNTLTAPPRWVWLRTLVAQFANLFSVLLDVSAALCFVADHMQPGEGMALLGWALVAVAVLNALFTFAQAIRAERAMQALRSMLPQRIGVRRGGVESEVLTAELVPGDVLLLSEGDRVPADARLVLSNDLLANNAPLTGESRHASLNASRVEEGRMVDAPNLVFAGCSLLRGSGTAVVYATGRRTEFGKIAALSVEVRRPPTPLEREVSRMVRILTLVALIMGIAFFAYGMAIRRPVWVNVVFMLGIIVANVPEGLLPTLTLALAMGGLRLAKKKVLVKSLNAVEALGSVEVICTDKTGTLTKNQLAVTDVVDALTGEPLEDAARRALLEAAVGASELHQHAGAFTGDPLDVAAADALTKLGGDPMALSRDIVRHLAFDVQRRRAAGVLAHGDSRHFAIKGAWEVVRPHVSVSGEALERGDATVRRLASQGLRVIAVASRRLRADEVDAPETSLEVGLELHGFLCLSDPLRDEVPDALARCHAAGIRVILVTGDHPDTARAIAERAGIVGQHAPAEAVLTGDALDSMRESDIVRRLEAGVAVFARTTPEQKLKIVSAVKRMGLLVAMTGDGVNDAPALRAADVGIAMGLSGTDVAREAAQIVLLDDNFASIVAGVEEGRTVFSNIRKFTSYVLASNVPEMLPFLAYVALPVPLGLTVIQNPLHRPGDRHGPRDWPRSGAAGRRGHEAPPPRTTRAPARREAHPAQLPVSRPRRGRVGHVHVLFHPASRRLALRERPARDQSRLPRSHGHHSRLRGVRADRQPGRTPLRDAIWPRRRAAPQSPVRRRRHARARLRLRGALLACHGRSARDGAERAVARRGRCAGCARAVLRGPRAQEHRPPVSESFRTSFARAKSVHAFRHDDAPLPRRHCGTRDARARAMARDHMLEELWNTAPMAPQGFDPSQVMHLPPTARRYFLHALAPGVKLAHAAHLRMHGTIRLGKEWQIFRAEQVLSWDRGFVWKARVGGALPIVGSDRWVDGEGSMRWKLLGIMPVMTADGPDISRSAAGRLQLESMWLPAVLLDPNVEWIAGDDDAHTEVVVRAHGEESHVELDVDDHGTPRHAALRRWGNPEGGEFHPAPFGIIVEDEGTFDGITVPTKIRAGWFFGTERFEQPGGEFFRAVVDHIDFR